jgi:hypothetical protein
MNEGLKNSKIERRDVQDKMIENRSIPVNDHPRCGKIMF